MTDGERWARAALERLQDGGYSPAAWLRFIAESRARATETRQARPLLARQARRWGAVGGAAWLGRSLLAPRRRVALVGLAWWALVWKMVDWHLGMVEGAQGERRERLSAADALTVARFSLAPLAAAPSTRRSFAALLAAGAIGDLADGRLAAHLGPTRLGREIDVTADIAFFGAATAGAARRGWLPTRAAGWLVARHAAALAFSTAHYLLQATPPPRLSARWSSPILVAGLTAAAVDHPRVADALVRGGSALPLAWHAWRWRSCRLDLAEAVEPQPVEEALGIDVELEQLSAPDRPARGPRRP